ncbi:hypothetical protein KDA14_06305, partial [Candidatus Saccharibacteria bacterium]|nr:hypothetical protein [Candidatus Saccharibacteria bacterium]
PVTDFFNWLGGHLGDLVTKIPGISNITELIGKLVGPLMDYIANKLISNVLVDGSNSDKSSDNTTSASSGASGLLAKAYAADTVDVTNTDSNLLPSGARIFNILAMGADASFNEECQAQLGCKGVSDETSAMIREQYIAKQKEQFQSKTFFARMFDTSTQYSLVSRLALSMPTNVSTASDNVATMLTTPGFGFIDNALNGLFADRSASAAVQTDAFGIAQSAFPDAEIKALGDFDKFYADNCEGDKFQSYTQSWLDDMKFDEDTGTTVASRVNGCLYIQSMAQS